MVVIRRELPRTMNAGPANGLPPRANEDSPFRGPLDRPLLGPELIVSDFSLSDFYIKLLAAEMPTPGAAALRCESQWPR